MSHGREYMSLGSVPSDEECEQLGPDYDPVKAKSESLRFIRGIINWMGEPPPGVALHAGWNWHDFGQYIDVRVYYYEDDDEQANYAYRCEGGLPSTWAELEAEISEEARERAALLWASDNWEVQSA